MLNQLKEIELNVVEYGTEEESNVDVALHLEAERVYGK